MKVVALTPATLAVFHAASQVVMAKEVSDIPRVNTPSPGEWPQSNVTGCGFQGMPYTNVLSECSEELDPAAPDLRGYWREKGGTTIEYIELCGSRWIDTSVPVIHDFPSCTGVVADGLGCQDYSAPDILIKDTTCTPIIAACKFEVDDNYGDTKCINLYSTNPATNTTQKVVSRCLLPDGTFQLKHPVFGNVVYEKLSSEEEPNCVKCVGGEHDGVAVYDSESELPCPHTERDWVRCEMEDDINEGEAKDEEGEDLGSGASNRIMVFSICFSVMCALSITLFTA